jgi:putative effector of murein hydrolase LrgA (UPF0299 family)
VRVGCDDIAGVGVGVGVGESASMMGARGSVGVGVAVVSTLHSALVRCLLVESAARAGAVRW